MDDSSEAEPCAVDEILGRAAGDPGALEGITIEVAADPGLPFSKKWLELG